MRDDKKQDKSVTVRIPKTEFAGNKTKTHLIYTVEVSQSAGGSKPPSESSTLPPWPSLSSLPVTKPNENENENEVGLCPITWKVLKTLADFHSLLSSLVTHLSSSPVGGSIVGIKKILLQKLQLQHHQLPTKDPHPFFCTSTGLLRHSRLVNAFARAVLSENYFIGLGVVKKFFNLEHRRNSMSICAGGLENLSLAVPDGGEFENRGNIIKEGVVEVCVGCRDITLAKKWKRRYCVLTRMSGIYLYRSSSSPPSSFLHHLPSTPLLSSHSRYLSDSGGNNANGKLKHFTIFQKDRTQEAYSGCLDWCWMLRTTERAAVEWMRGVGVDAVVGPVQRRSFMKGVIRKNNWVVEGDSDSSEGTAHEGTSRTLTRHDYDDDDDGDDNDDDDDDDNDNDDDDDDDDDDGDDDIDSDKIILDMTRSQKRERMKTTMPRMGSFDFFTRHCPVGVEEA